MVVHLKGYLHLFVCLFRVKLMKMHRKDGRDHIKEVEHELYFYEQIDLKNSGTNFQLKKLTRYDVYIHK